MSLTTPKVTGTEVLGGGRRGESITTEVTVIVEVNTMSMINDDQGEPHPTIVQIFQD